LASWRPLLTRFQTVLSSKTRINNKVLFSLCKKMFTKSWHFLAFMPKCHIHGVKLA
jgi:hypothetical protein